MLCEILECLQNPNHEERQVIWGRFLISCLAPCQKAFGAFVKICVPYDSTTLTLIEIWGPLSVLTLNLKTIPVKVWGVDLKSFENVL